MKKMSDFLLRVFGIGMTVCLFAGGLSLIAYGIALVIGGEPATALCTFTFNTYLPWVIKFTSIFVGVGLAGMYFAKQKALTVQTENVMNGEDMT